MNTKKLIVAVALTLLVVFVVSGCGSQTSVVTSDMPQIIQTYGEAEVKAEPDLARISLAIETRSNSAEQAVEENARLANAVFEALSGFGLTEDEIKTGSYQLYSYREWFEERLSSEELITYQVSNEVVVSTSRIDEVGEIIDLAIRSGANNINYINFELENPQELQLQALKTATEQAKKKAEAIAESADERISGLFRIQEERTEYIPFVVRQDGLAEEAAMGAPTPITPDEVTVKAMVKAEFSF